MLFGSILGDRKTQKRIFLNAGHSNNDPGIIIGNLKEADEVKKVRDFLSVMLLKGGFEVVAIPDEYNLRQSIDFVNEKAWLEDMGLAIDIHLNFVGQQTDCTLSGCPPSVSGTEVYSGNSVGEKAQAAILSESLSQTIGTKNRGWKSQSQSAFGSLGWISQIKCWSHIIECLYLSDINDRKLIEDGRHREIAQGIYAGILRLYGMSDPAEIKEDPRIPLMLKIKELTAMVVSLMSQLINKLKGH